jgi:hypothetical protein
MLVVLKSVEGERFSLSEVAARQSIFIDHLLSSANNFGDRDSESPKVIECPIHSTILRKVAQYLSMSNELAALDAPDAVANLNCVEEDDEVLVGLLLASDFLDVPKLLQATSLRIKQILTGGSNEGRKAVLVGRIMDSTINTSILDIWGPSSSDRNSSGPEDAVLYVVQASEPRVERLVERRPRIGAAAIQVLRDWSVEGLLRNLLQL